MTVDFQLTSWYNGVLKRKQERKESDMRYDRGDLLSFMHHVHDNAVGVYQVNPECDDATLKLLENVQIEDEHALDLLISSKALLVILPVRTSDLFEYRNSLRAGRTVITDDFITLWGDKEFRIINLFIEYFKYDPERLLFKHIKSKIDEELSSVSVASWVGESSSLPFTTQFLSVLRCCAATFRHVYNFEEGFRECFEQIAGPVFASLSSTKYRSMKKLFQQDIDTDFFAVVDRTRKKIGAKRAAITRKVNKAIADGITSDKADDEDVKQRLDEHQKRVEHQREFFNNYIHGTSSVPDDSVYKFDETCKEVFDEVKDDWAASDKARYMLFLEYVWVKPYLQQILSDLLNTHRTSGHVFNACLPQLLKIKQEDFEELTPVTRFILLTDDTYSSHLSNIDWVEGFFDDAQFLQLRGHDVKDLATASRALRILSFSERTIRDVLLGDPPESEDINTIFESMLLRMLSEDMLTFDDVERDILDASAEKRERLIWVLFHNNVTHGWVGGMNIIIQRILDARRE